MPSLLVKNLDASLLREVNYAASKAELTQRDWVVKVLERAVGWVAEEVMPNAGSRFPTSTEAVAGEHRAETSADSYENRQVPEHLRYTAMDLPGRILDDGRPPHDPRTCRVYGCMRCAVAEKE